MGDKLMYHYPPLSQIHGLAEAEIEHSRWFNICISGNANSGASRHGITFEKQDLLPKLPIPSLESTCRKYLDSLAPLQSPREHKETKSAVRKFLRDEGPTLQKKLQLYASSKTSYIEQFCKLAGTLVFMCIIRELISETMIKAVVLNLNPFFLLEDDPTPARNHQVTRAASLVVSALSFVRAVRREELAPDVVRGNPLCMFQFSRLFGTARVPNEHGCVINQDLVSKHLVVLCRGQCYWFDVLDKTHDLIMTEKDISVNLRAIIEDAEQTPIEDAAKGAIGVLSTENRKIWFRLREILNCQSGSNNADCLKIIDTALFVLCLDYTEPSNIAEICGNMLCGTSEVVKGVQIGTCTNRWYDKLQIIVCRNGSAGINFGHTSVDGHTVLRFASDVFTDTILRFAKTINGQAPSMWASTSPTPSRRKLDAYHHSSTTPRKLEWDMSVELSTAVRFAESHLADLLHQHEFETLDFCAYGKSFITSVGISPDAFLQMAFQAAYYGLYGRVENTYEPAMTKTFLHGRTEAIRTVSSESVNFVTTFWGNNPTTEKVAALRIATQKHSVITKECLQGQGHDRHLYALYCLWQRSVGEIQTDAGSGGPSLQGDYTQDTNIAKDNCSSASGHSQFIKIPAIFNDPGWDKINNTILSTSNCGNPSLRHFGFGPTSGGGFGIGYIIKDDSISICTSSKHRQTSRFMQALESYLLEIRRLLQAPLDPKSGPTSSTAQENSGTGTRTPLRGRVIRTDYTESAIDTPATQREHLDNDGLGGYGFFDAGMLRHALQVPQEGVEKEKQSIKEKVCWEKAET
ncbi:carnitine O-acetyltransferase yat1 [Ophidiomyces ophidiicola]|nr:carnitine O-acetyltransferase yat1 [Ophidiomyces ophidiicola]KAI1943159.1 carnitine O-acetyltransferase yat1 [Ophidiomyces ophidiicola]KAI2064836.1 carnitine O-acetyltransferase yat1 [Ophidiomyces ophidiicola]KAI2076852.1 carnitine O-acetyltransferase yat1 [Ophidiomyces ophidiicola]KAI2114863.1 carnitine O-acetyltransferase yat1 [Ophidiomyces ophidiicola]